jgi:hypothetical protein
VLSDYFVIYFYIFSLCFLRFVDILTFYLPSHQLAHSASFYALCTKSTDMTLYTVTLWGCSVWFLAGIPSFQTNPWRLPPSHHNCFLPNTFQFISYPTVQCCTVSTVAVLLHNLQSENICFNSTLSPHRLPFSASCVAYSSTAMMETAGSSEILLVPSYQTIRH